MQVWDSVQVTKEGDLQGVAGVVQKIEGKDGKEKVTVKLDNDTTEVFAIGDLKQL